MINQRKRVAYINCSNSLSDKTLNWNLSFVPTTVVFNVLNSPSGNTVYSATIPNPVNNRNEMRFVYDRKTVSCTINISNISKNNITWNITEDANHTASLLRIKSVIAIE